MFDESWFKNFSIFFEFFSRHFFFLFFPIKKAKQNSMPKTPAKGEHNDTTTEKRFSFAAPQFVDFEQKLEKSQSNDSIDDQWLGIKFKTQHWQILKLLYYHHHSFFQSKSQNNFHVFPLDMRDTNHNIVPIAKKAPKGLIHSQIITLSFSSHDLILE